jgi:cyanophycinase
VNPRRAVLLAAAAVLGGPAAGAAGGGDPGASTPRPVRPRVQAIPACRGALAGNPLDVPGRASGGLVLAGGGSDVDDAFRWMIARAGGGDVVVLRASGTDAYNDYILGLGGPDSVETLIVADRARAEDSCLARIVLGAEAVFIAGGDQSDYVRHWAGTTLSAAISAVAQRPSPLGGTSAGLAILGEFAFAALEGGVLSREALRDPYHPAVTLVRGVLAVPGLAGVITDSHFRERDRFGRLLAFMARILADGLASEVRGVGIDEATALLVDADGSARRVGRGSVYMLRAVGPPSRCVAGEPLTFEGIEVTRLDGDATFDLRRWAAGGATGYRVSATAGELSSTQPGGSVY